MVRRLRTFLAVPLWIVAVACHLAATVLMLAATAIEGSDMRLCGDDES